MDKLHAANIGFADYIENDIVLCVDDIVLNLDGIFLYVDDIFCMLMTFFVC